ncbi:MAG: hypothetical protein NTZ59_11670 [Bacteroidetes bacterium]|nr:hypothetical protein [Bacteroidota bacterium]
MKIESTLIKELFASIKYFTEAISETINLGEDGFTDAVKDLTAEIDKAIDTFDVMNMQELTKVDIDKKYEYLQHYEKYAYDLANANEKKIYKAKLYLHIKKVIRDEIKAEVLASVSNENLMSYIEVETIHNSSFLHAFNSNEFFTSTLLVLQDVVDEIKKQREKAPQQKLF